MYESKLARRKWLAVIPACQAKLRTTRESKRIFNSNQLWQRKIKERTTPRRACCATCKASVITIYISSLVPGVEGHTHEKDNNNNESLLCGGKNKAVGGLD